MTITEFLSHGWKATDKVVYDKMVCSVIGVTFNPNTMALKDQKNRYHNYISIDEIELYKENETDKI